MTLLPHAVVPDADPFRGPLPHALGGGPLTLVAAGGLAFACSFAPPGEPDVERLLAFAGVVRALHSLGTILPLRYGPPATADALDAKLLARRDEFRADLARLDGLEEVTVRAVLPEPAESPAAPAASPGTAYLLARRQRYSRDDARAALAQRIIGECRERLAGAFVDLAHELPRQPDATLAVHFLVRRGSVDAFAAAVRAAGCFPADARVLGPWPAYHFLASPPPLSAADSR